VIVDGAALGRRRLPVELGDGIAASGDVGVLFLGAGESDGGGGASVDGFRIDRHGLARALAQALVLNLGPGQKLKVIESENPTAENLAFVRAVLEDCVLGVDLPPQALFHLAGITGPGIRYNMEDIDRWILLQHLWQAKKCQVIYARTIAKEIKAGRLRQPVHKGQPLPWWRPGQTHWFGLPSMTIDRGRDSRMSVVRLDMGLTTWADEHSKEGAFWKKEIKARVREVAFAKRCVWDENKLLREQTEGEVTMAYEEVIRRPNTTLLIGEDSANKPQPDPAE